MQFDEAFEILIGHEGEFQNRPSDRGNWTSGKIGVGQLKGTKYGISAMTYPDWDIANLTLAQAKALYRRDFWDAAKIDALPPALRFDVFDTAVNSGPWRATMFLQRAVGVAVDGKYGPVTAAAVKAMAEGNPHRLISRFNGARLDFMNDNPTLWAEYGRGWAQRIADNLLRT